MWQHLMMVINLHMSESESESESGAKSLVWKSLIESKSVKKARTKSLSLLLSQVPSPS